MLMVSGPALSGFLNYYVLRYVPWSMLAGSRGSSGGALALAAACCRRNILETLKEIYTPSSVVDMARLTGSARRLSLYREWLLAATGDADITFAQWPSQNRKNFEVLAFDCHSLCPVVFSVRTTPSVRIADALTAATAWPSVTDAHEINSTLFCDVEFLIPPPLLCRFIAPSPVILLQGKMKSMRDACSARNNMELWCAMFEHYGKVMEGMSSRVSPPFVVTAGPHILDTLITTCDVALEPYLHKAVRAAGELAVALVALLLLRTSASDVAHETFPSGYINGAFSL